jgi:16S rRNA processing protein RimM
MQLVVGRIAKAHGIGGEVSVDVRTDDADRRFADGSQLQTDPPERGPLVVERSRWHSGRLLVRFAGVRDRTGAEALRATMLVVDSATCEPPDDKDEFWDHDLIGVEVFTADGEPLGSITDVLHPPGPDLLVIARSGGDSEGAELLLPFVAEFVPTVDLPARRVVIRPPEGLLEL